MNSKIPDKKWDYVVDGKHGGLAPIVIFGAIAAFFVVLTVDQLKPAENKYTPIALMFAGIALMLLYSLATAVIRYFCYKVLIGEDGFYLQTTPFDARYYSYDEIASCSEQLITSHSRRNGRSYRYYFSFSTYNGERRNVIFDKAMHEREFEVLAERINK